MLQPYLVVGSHLIRIHVDAGGKQCECPVLLEDGIALIIAPQIWEIQREIYENKSTLLLSMRRLDARIRLLNLSNEERYRYST